MTLFSVQPLSKDPSPAATAVQAQAVSSASAPSSLSSRVEQAIQNAASKTGVNFAYLMNKAQAESGMDPNAKSSASTATGLFQFTSGTWLKTVKDHGASYGLGNYADHITVDGDGAAHVQDPKWKQAILGLRKDPTVSAEMAGELDKDNSASLQANVGGKIGSTELYLAHFLGSGGATTFLKTLHSNPSAKAADILPTAAQANSTVFYNTDGSPRSVQQIYQHFADKFDGSATVQIASSRTPSASSSYRMADAASSISSAGVTAPTSSVKPTTSSLFATMVLAQMHMNDNLSSSQSADHDKKNAISILGSLA